MIEFVSLGPDDYERAKKVLDKARHPGFVGRELYYRCATKGTCTIVTLDGEDVGVALIANNKLQAMSVVQKAQGSGVGSALLARTKPLFVNCIGEKIAWFEKRGYSAVGAAKVGQSGKHTTQLMQLTKEAAIDQNVGRKVIPMTPEVGRNNGAPSVLEESKRIHGVPFKPGYDPRRVIPDTTGKTYRPSAKRILKKVLSQHGGEVDGVDASRYDVGLYLLVRDMIDPDIAPVDRHRAAMTVLAYVEGRPVQQIVQQSTVTLQTDEQRLAKVNAEMARLMSGESTIEAEFSEVPKQNETESDEFEA